MNSTEWFAADGGNNSQEVLWQDGDRVLCRRWRDSGDGEQRAFLALILASEHPNPGSLDRLTHEYELRDALDEAWAVRPLELVRERERTMLVLESPAGEPLEGLIGQPMEIEKFLRLSIAASAAIGRLHERGLVHKDVKPINILVNSATGQAWLTGFGIASRLPRDLQSPQPPEFIAGTLAYIAPEQTGRMNRSIDSRSDLYSLGVTLYQTLTGALPFTASDPMEWVHCHIAKRPVPPNERLKDVPAAVSAIILKLLAKTPEERYQTAAGAESDFRRCLTEWQSRQRIDEFPLGGRDTPDRLVIPEKLYGRARDVDLLLASFNRVAVGGRPELVLVSGYSGIGKSSVVNELHKPLVPRHGLFASGKFDQYKRDIPYATLAQAFQTLVRTLLGKSEAELGRWRDAFREALGPNGQLIVDLVPELTLIIGEQPAILTLSPEDARRRFQLVFERFLAVFARPEHPLAVFLDDLQWLDMATLDLLEDILSRSDVQHLMIIGAYRDNEVGPTHPLRRKIEALRRTGATVQDIVLAPLGREDLDRLVGDALHCNTERAAPLTQLVHERTAGNPFFSIQFLSALAEEGLLTFDYGTASWSWDLDRIDAKGYTENVVDLVVAKLSRLPDDTQKALQQLACLGSSADFGLLRTVYHDCQEDMHARLWEAVRTRLIVRAEESYRFVHDRVQEAAYSLVPEQARAAAHLRIGRLLAASVQPAESEEKIFEIVNQFNRGSELLASAEEREWVAELNLIAGRRAKLSTAYASALNYLAAGRALLTDEAWRQKPELVFGIEYLMAECELLTASMVVAEKRLAMLAERANTDHDIAAVTGLRLRLFTTVDQSDRAVEVFLEYLRRGGTNWSAHPTGDEVLREYNQIWSQLGSRQIEDLIDLPLMTNATALEALEVLSEVVTPALFFDENLSSLVICRMVNLSLAHGNSDGSCFAYVRFAMISGPRFGNYKDGYRFGRLGYQLVEKRGLKRYKARTYMCFGDIVIPWTRHVRAGRDLVRRAFEAANEIGDLTFAAYSCNHLITNCLAAGDPLGDVQREAERGLAFAQTVRFGHVIYHITAQLALIRTLRGLTNKFGSFDEEGFDELRFERKLASNSVLAEPEFWYWARKLQARVFSMDHASAVDASLKAERLLWTSPSQFETAEFRFYGALAHAAAWQSSPPNQRTTHFERLISHYKQLAIWAENCRENFDTRAFLVGAEIARIEDRALDAERLYERSIESARGNGFVHNEALANELAARFYATRGLPKIARVYLQDARDGYVRWGADGKVRQLDEFHPQLEMAKQLPSPTRTILAPIEHLDLATVIKVSQAVSGEIILEKLIDTLMRTAIEHAGAERGLLILARGNEFWIEAEATTGNDTITVGFREAEPTTADLPASVLHYVARTKETVLLHDASAQTQFSDDEYVRRHKARSILCLPLLKQTRIIGVLYIENNLTVNAFTPARLAILTLLASDAATSLENTRLYSDLREREARVRRLIDSNIVGIFIWCLDGRIVDANQAFLNMVGYGRDDLSAARMRWTDLTPEEWRDADAQRVTELKMTGSARPYEKEYFRKDGTRVPVLVGAANFEGTRDEGVAFVLDLTDRKQAEVAARESEIRYREVQMALAHANRVATMGQLSASIAHEVNQPIAAVVTNAHAALRWLSAKPQDIEEVREALGRIVKDGNRAGAVVHRIRALVKKAPPRKDGLEINQAILEVIALAHGEIEKNGVSVRMQFAEGLPLIQGDRVQLQQVILNLIINAVEAMSSDSTVSRELLISTSCAEPNSVSVAVRDSGPGLDPMSLDRVFEAFYTTKPDGLGMGLAICRSIIEAHGGQLWATAATPEGAVFNFTLPVLAEGKA